MIEAKLDIANANEASILLPDISERDLDALKEHYEAEPMQYGYILFRRR